MKNKEIIQRIDEFLEGKGVLRGRHYTWSIQGPTLIYIGEKNTFSDMTLGDLAHIRRMGVQFLIEP